MSESISTFLDSNHQSKWGYMRVRKGQTFLLPLMAQPDDVLLQLLSEQLPMSIALAYDATHLKRLGFVIANDEEILSREFLRLQPWDSRLGLVAQRIAKSGFLNPIRRMVMQQHRRKKKRVPQSRTNSNASIQQMAKKLFREEVVLIRRQDLLTHLSTQAASHVTRRLHRLASSSEHEMQDAEMLKQVKEKCLTFKRTPIFLARSNPFPKPSEVVVDDNGDLSGLARPKEPERISVPVTLSGTEDTRSSLGQYIAGSMSSTKSSSSVSFSSLAMDFDDVSQDPDQMDGADAPMANQSDQENDIDYDSSSQLISLPINIR